MADTVYRQISGVSPESHCHVRCEVAGPRIGRGRARRVRKSMERTRIFRRTWFWVILVVLGAILLTGVFSGGGDYKKIKTSEAVALLNGDNVKRAVMQDKEQT